MESRFDVIRTAKPVKYSMLDFYSVLLFVIAVLFMENLNNASVICEKKILECSIGTLYLKK